MTKQGILIKAPPKRNIEVVRFGGEDLIPSEVKLKDLQKSIKECEDLIPSEVKLKDLQKSIEECEDLYPGIDLWFLRKVLPELKVPSRRSALVLYDEGQPVGVAVIRRGKESTKLCNMRIRDDYQKRGLGHLMIKLVLAEIRNYQTDGIHFTVPEHIWRSHVGEFLKAYGFEFKDLAKVQYRARKKKMGLLFNPDPEYACSASYSTVKHRMREKINEGFENFTLSERFEGLDLLLSIRPKYARQIIQGEKRIELRRRFSEKWRGARVAIYSTDPDRSLLGEATVMEVFRDTPNNIWSEWKDELGCTFEEFSEYSSGKAAIYAIRLGEVTPYVVPIPLSQLEFHLDEDLPVPQSYLSLKSKDKWQSALKWGSILSANR